MIEVKEIDKWPDNDKWAKARKDWDAMPKDEKEAYRREHAAAIDRWEAETDAMAEDDDTEEKKKELRGATPSLFFPNFDFVAFNSAGYRLVPDKGDKRK